MTLTKAQRETLWRVWERAQANQHLFNPSTTIGTRVLSVAVRSKLESLGLIRRVRPVRSGGIPPFLYFDLTDVGLATLRGVS